jgi:hypothetical protein
MVEYEIIPGYPGAIRLLSASTIVKYRDRFSLD